MKQKKRGLWAFVFKNRNVLATLPLVYAFFSTTWEWENDLVIWPLAIAIAASGGALRGWSRCHCLYSTGSKKSLATTGPYSLIRNPLYIGNTLILIGATVASGLVWLIPITIVWAFIVYSGTIKHEGTRLEQKYGQECLDYRSKVRAWVPKLASWGKLRLGRPTAQEAREIATQTIYAGLLLLPFVAKDYALSFLGG